MNDRYHSSTTTYYQQPNTQYYSITTPQQQPRYDSSTLFNFEADQPLFDFQAEQYSQAPSQSLMPSAESWYTNGQLTPTSATRARHHRESSLSSLGSAGPASPFTANTSNPQVAGELYHEYEYQPASTKPLTPAHTPSQEHFLNTQYNNYYQSSLPFGMSQEAAKVKQELMATSDYNRNMRPSMSAVANRESPSTPPTFEDERQKNVYRNVPKLERTMTDIYSDELYNPNFSLSSTTQASVPAPIVTVSPHNDVFHQRLQAANSQHMNSQPQLMIPPRDKSPFRQGSPLAPVSNGFQSQGLRFNTATQIREKQKAEADARALQQQIERSSPSGAAPTTISPKDVDLVYHETEEDRSAPLFPPQQRLQSPVYRQQPVQMTREPTETEELPSSQQSFGSMATSRRDSSSGYSVSSSGTQQNNFSFVPPAVPGGIRIPQQYPFVPQSRRQPSNLSEASDAFPATLTSMESSSSEYAGESTGEAKRPVSTMADSGTYTCTYHGCTLRFDSPAKLQRHKREGHRNSTSVLSSSDADSAANRNSQAGPHKCERINPSTGKPCNTIFSRPYDLTRHEDTIHNARKQKVHCPICTEEKTFSRNDALTRHMRVVHPQYTDQSSRRRRGGS